MSVAPGTRLGPYEIVDLLGTGGMGEVYRARDTRLGRIVAVKALPADKLADEERKRRFVAEARAASALNHPNIIAIHDLAAANGAEFLVMEYVPGKTLDHAIPKRGLRLNETLRYAIQIADALAAAHEAGIVHRDLKPGNVMVTPSGTVKLLDFGVAKLMARDAWRSGDATRTVATVEGAIVGTVSYMSPEQAEGKPVDGRSDIFSFGCVLYEMLTGHRAFQGDSAMSTLSAVLRSEPTPITQLAPTVPHDAERVINRCLRKDRDRRFQTARDLKVALQELLDESSSAVLTAPSAPVSKRNLRLWLGGALVLIVTGVAALWLASSTPEHPSSPMLESRLTAYEGFEMDPAFSPDGNQIVFVWNRDGANADIYVRLIGAGQPVQLTNTPELESSPAWSPDGRWIAFLRTQPQNATESLLGVESPSSGPERAAVFVMPSIGGGERKIAEPVVAMFGVLATRVRWCPDGKCLVVTGSSEEAKTAGLLRLDVTTGEKQRLTSPPPQSADVAGSFSPDGQQIGFLRQHSGNMQGHIYLLNVDASFRGVSDPRPLTIDGVQVSAPVWTIDGKEVLFEQAGRGGLWRASIAGGAPVRVPVAGNDPRQPTIHGSRLAYVQQVSDLNIWAVPTSGAGEPVRVVASTLNDMVPQYSPDGSRIAFCSDQSGTIEIWVARSDGSRQEKLTSFDSGQSCSPRWSPDSSRIVFDSNAETGQFEVYIVGADGGQPKRLTDHPGTDAAPSFSRDGNWIYFTSNRTGRDELWKLPIDGGHPVQVTVHGGYVGLESVDGQSLYFTKQYGGALWRMPPGGGRESKVLEHVAQRNFMPVADGIYFMQRSERGHSFQFLDFATRQMRTVGSMTRESSHGVSISADGRWLAYVQQDHAGSDIVLVENFR